MKKVKATGYRVLVRLKDLEEDIEVRSEGGIIVELNSKRDVELKKAGVCEAYVIDIGDCAGYSTMYEGQKLGYKVGDCVQVARHAGSPLPDLGDGLYYRLVQDLDIECVFPGEGIKL